MRDLLDNAGRPLMCEVCGNPAKGSSFDVQWSRVHWYCREHHPMMPTGVKPITGPASGGKFWLEPGPELAEETRIVRNG